MAHFAEIDNEGTVLRVIVVSNDDCAGGDLPESEPAGQAFIASIGLEGTWKQTSYNNSFRVRYAGVGYTYNSELDAFIPPKPYPSWTLNEETASWEAPTPMPTDDKIYVWDEENQTWNEFTV